MNRPAKPETALVVTATQRLSPTMIRVSFRSDDLSAFSSSVFTDRYVKLVFPQVDGEVVRTYTALNPSVEDGTLDIDFVVHGTEGYAGPWAAAAKPGDTLAARGPGGAYSPDPEADWHLIAGDETALPAIARILAEAAPTAVGTALLEVAGPAEEQPLPAPAGVTVRWLHRGATPPGESTLLIDAVAGLDRPAGDDVFAWVAAESAAVRAIRADLRGRWGLGRAQHHAIGYWRRGRAMSPSG